MKLPLASYALAVLAAVPTAMLASHARATTDTEVITPSKLEFIPLNPARGDASPQAGVLWGDITEDLTSGVLLKFADGFSSPPHIHNITYRAVVISGAIHNDDPEADAMWMGPGSFWTQPAGETHITAARAGSGAMAFLEIQEGPYLVQPSTDAFDNGERPLNLEASNVVWVSADQVRWLDSEAGSTASQTPQIAFLWGAPDDDTRNGSFLKLPTGYSGDLHGNDHWLRAVLIAGTASLTAPGETDAKSLEPGSYIGSKGGDAHTITCETKDGCVFYVHAKGRYRFIGR